MPDMKALLAITVILASSMAAADTAQTVFLDAFVEGGAIMLAASDVVKPADLKLNWDADTDLFTLSGPTGALEFTVGSATVTTVSPEGAKTPGELPVAPRYAGHLLHLPLVPMLALLKADAQCTGRDERSASIRVGETTIRVRILPEADKLAIDVSRGSVVKLVTSAGTIYLDLFDQGTPITAGNFLDLVLRGYYDGIKFHRVIADFMIQGGDPRGDGTGGPGFTIPDEADRGLRHYRGSLSMAKTSAPDTGGSQFFICHRRCDHLDGIHTVFGRCVGGLDVVDSVRGGDVIREATMLRKSVHADIAIRAAMDARVIDAPPPEEVPEGNFDEN